MSSRTQRFLPTKIQRNRHAPRTKPEQFDEVIREAFDFSRKISKKSAFDKDTDHFIRETYQGHIEKRRKAALQRSLNDILQRKAPTDMKDAAASDHRQVQLTFEEMFSMFMRCRMGEGEKRGWGKSQLAVPDKRRANKAYLFVP